jgi:DNA polymerase alpha subunit A
MTYEFTERALYNQLLYLQNMFDADRAKEKLGKEMGVEGEEREKAGVTIDLNRERFGTWKGVVSGYLDKNGRQWVQMDSLFGFAVKT